MKFETLTEAVLAYRRKVNSLVLPDGQKLFCSFQRAKEIVELHARREDDGSIIFPLERVGINQTPCNDVMVLGGWLLTCSLEATQFCPFSEDRQFFDVKCADLEEGRCPYTRLDLGLV